MAPQLKNTVKDKNESAGRLEDTPRTDPALRQEINDIENKLNNVHLSDVDERSDFHFS